MNPELHLFWNMAALALFWIGTGWRVRRSRIAATTVIDGAVYITVGVVVGAWAANAVPRLVNVTLGDGAFTPWWVASQHWIGAVAGGAAVTYLWLRWRKLPVGICFDAAAPFVALALAVARIGCYVNADSYGWATDAWFAMWLPDPQGIYAMRYPTQLVSIGVNLLIAGLLLAFEWYTTRQLGKPAHWPFAGFLFLLYVTLYCLQRSYFEFWRADMYPFAGPFTWTHFYCGIALILAIWAMQRGLRSKSTHPGR